MKRKRDCGFGYRVVPCQQDPDDPRALIVTEPVMLHEGDWINVELPNESLLAKVVCVTVHYVDSGRTYQEKTR